MYKIYVERKIRKDIFDLIHLYYNVGMYIIYDLQCQSTYYINIFLLFISRVIRIQLI